MRGVRKRCIWIIQHHGSVPSASLEGLLHQLRHPFACFAPQQRFSQSLTSSDTMKTEEASPVRNSRSAEGKQSEVSAAGFCAGQEPQVQGLPAADVCAGVTP